MDEDAKKTANDLKLHLEDSQNIELVAEDLKRKAAENAAKLKQSDLQSAADAVLKKEENTKEVAGALHTESPIKPLRTFQGDVADAIERQKASLIKIKLAEEERQRAEVLANPHESGARYGVRAIMLVSSIILVLIGGTIFAVTKYVGKAPVAKPVEVKYDTLIPYSDSIEMNVSRDGRDDLASRFTELRGMEIAPASIKYLKLVETAPTGAAAIPTSKFFRILATKAPQKLLRAFSDAFMAGAYGTAKAEPFVLIRVDSFDNAYSGMLEWENTMVDDIGPLFTSENLSFNNGPLPGPLTLSTTTEASSDSHEQSIFDDLVVNNRDTRVVRNEEGKVVFLYSFVDPNLLLITTNEEAFQGMVNKLVASKLIR